MDVASLLTLLLLALALAVQPWSVLAAVLLVTSQGGVAKAVAYVAGWALALAAVAVATIALPAAAEGSVELAVDQLGHDSVRGRPGRLVAGAIAACGRGEVESAAEMGLSRHECGSCRCSFVR